MPRTSASLFAVLIAFLFKRALCSLTSGRLMATMLSGISVGIEVSSLGTTTALPNGPKSSLLLRVTCGVKKRGGAG
jgi:hypothetical protein